MHRLEASGPGSIHEVPRRRQSFGAAHHGDFGEAGTARLERWTFSTGSRRDCAPVSAAAVHRACVPCFLGEA